MEAGVPHDEESEDGFEPIDVVKDNRRTKDLLRAWAKKVREEKKKAKEEQKKKEKEEKREERKDKAEL